MSDERHLTKTEQSIMQGALRRSMKFLPEDPPEGGDPNAALPPNAPPYVKAFYDTVNKLIDEIHASDPIAGNALTGIWDWMTTHVPERFLRP